MIARRNSEIVKTTGNLELPEFAACNSGYIGELSDRAAF